MPYEITTDCIICGTCIEECPSDAIEENDDIYIINNDRCTECVACMEICPTEAIIIN